MDASYISNAVTCKISIEMARLELTCFAAFVICFALVHGAVRVARSPQLGGFSQANAQAQAGGFGRRGFGPRPPIFERPRFGPRPPIFGGASGGIPGGSISISKSISISSGGGGAQSSAGSTGFGK